MTGVLKINKILPFILLLVIICSICTVSADASRKGILVVTDSADADVMQRTEALKKYLVYYRQKYGFNSSSMPILVYDYNDSRARKYCQKKLGIQEEDVMFVGIVSIQGQVPLKVHMKVVDPKNLENNARGLVEKIAGVSARNKPENNDKPGAKGSVLIESEPKGVRVFVDGREYGHTPLTLKELKTGRHVVVLQHEKKRWNGEFYTSPDKHVKVAHSFLDPTGIPVPPPISPDTPAPEPTSAPVMESFVPRSEANLVFRLTVSNQEESLKIKDHYKPKPGYKFQIIYLSQQNISNELQVYSGKLSLVDNGNKSYEAIENLSNFWLVVLRPAGMITGYLVYEIPKDAKPARLVLHGLNMSPLSVNLQ